ncbi:MAG TPA: gephyrin-like molybdotransferase Glp [Anaerolineaceae bacterium]
MNLLSVSEARERILKHFSPLDLQEVSLENALGRVLFENISASIDLPTFSNSGMDGFAVRAADISQAATLLPVELTVVMDIPAGAAPKQVLGAGEAARIMTGAMLPEGADCIIPLENTDRDGQSSAYLGQPIKIFRTAHIGEYVRTKGQDMSKGQLVLERGRRLEPQDIGLLATLGIVKVKVIRRPRVAILSSGDEIISPDAPLEPGKIRDSNSFMISALITQAGGEVLRLGVAHDILEAIRDLLDQAASYSVDLIITSAGVSVGAFDFVRTAVEKNGQLEFWRVNMRPGKPLSFGSYKGIPFVGLPGNPVSAYVGFEVFVRPALGRLSGLSNVDHPVTRVTLGEPIESDERESYLRASLKHENGQTVAYLTSHQGSGNLFSLVLANALLIVPSGVKSLPIGAEVDSWLLGSC